VRVVNGHPLISNRSNGQEPFCSAIKRSSSKSDGQDILTQVMPSQYW